VELRSSTSNRNPLDLIERDLIAGAIIELRCARAFVRSHELRVFQCAAGLQVGRYSGGPEGVAADLDLHAEFRGAALDHAPGVDPVHRPRRECAGAADGRAEQGTLFVVGDAGGTEVFIEEGFELVVRRHFVALAAFLVKADPPALPVGKIILDPHRHHGADAGEGVGHDPDQGAVAQADEGRGVDALDQRAGLVGREHGGLAALDDVLGAANRGGGIAGEDAAGDEPIEQHADGGEVLLDGRLRHPVLERLYIGGDVKRLDIDQRHDPGGVEPGEEVRHRPVIGHAGVLVADGGGEEFQEAPHRGIAGAGDRRRHGEAATSMARCRGCPGTRNWNVTFRAIFGRIFRDIFAT
jgi:hypothetical protein